MIAIAPRAQRGDQSYFIDAGLPADQIRDIHASFHGIGGGPANGTSVAPFQLESINSILTRSISGVPVIKSVAWAKMTISGDVDMECVFWPPINSAVVQRAVAFQRSVIDPDAKAAYLGKLPGPVYRDGGVVIHHTDPSIHAAPTAYVSYDVTLGPQGYSAMRHFDESGTEFRLPQELASPPRPPTELNSKSGLR